MLEKLAPTSPSFLPVLSFLFTLTVANGITVPGLRNFAWTRNDLSMIMTRCASDASVWAARVTSHVVLEKT